MNTFLAELRRRNIFRVAGVYAVVGWILMQVAGALEASLHLPDWFDSAITAALLIGFPLAMLLAWAFEMTPEGVKRTEAVAEGQSVSAKTGRTLDIVIVVGLVLVGALIVGSQFTGQNGAGRDHDNVPAKTGEFAGQSIAVLPFEDFSPKHDQAYFADGIAEELLNVLARVKGLRVASRTSAFSFKGKEASIAEIGQALNVNHVLEGSVRKAGSTLRITAQLIDTKTDEHLWSETYDRPLTAENIFVIQDEISKAIVLELNGRLDLLPETDERLTQSTEALEAYLKGKESYGSRNIADIETGITELIRAVTIDPEFAVAHAKLARAYTLEKVYGASGNLNAFPRAQIHIERAQALAPDDWDVLSEYAWVLEAIRGNVVGNDITFDQVIAAFEAAIAANPNNAEAHRGKGYVLYSAGQNEAAKISLQRAKELNPRDSLILLNLSGIAEQQGDLEAAKALTIEALRIAPESLQNWANVAQAYQSLGDVETAHRIYQSCRVEKACVTGLAVLYSKLGIDARGFGTLDDYALLVKNYVAGDYDKVAQVLFASTAAPLTAKVNWYAAIGRWDAAYKLIQDNPSEFAPILAGLPGNDAETILREIAVLATLERQGDPRTSALRVSLTNKYKNAVPPGELTVTTVYTNGAAWAMLNGDPDRAMVWLNALADLGKSTIVFQDALLEPLTSRADYQAFRARMDGYAARDRALIEAQLANPPKVWWDPKEVLKSDKP